jgi:hypothetical protein
VELKYVMKLPFQKLKQLCVVWVAFLGGSQTLTGQKWSPRDSIRISLQRKPEFSAGLDSRRSYLRGKPIDIFGLRIGADYRKTAGYIGLYSTVFQDQTNDRYEYFYLSGIGEYRWFKNYRWFLAQTVQMGVGTANLSLKNPNGTYDYRDLMLIPIETGVSATYRVWRYFGLSAGLGARFSLTPNSYFSASYYTFGICFYPDEISKTVDKVLHH